MRVVHLEAARRALERLRLKLDAAEVLGVGAVPDTELEAVTHDEDDEDEDDQGEGDRGE